MAPAQVRPATTYPALLGRVLKELRERAGLDQANLAHSVGVTQPTWSRIERGDIPATVEQLALAAAPLRMTPGQLLTMTDHAVQQARAQGIEVILTRANANLEAGLVLVGAAALALLVAAALAKK